MFSFYSQYYFYKIKIYKNNPYRVNVIKKYYTKNEIYHLIWNKYINFIYNSARIKSKWDLNKRNAFKNFSNVKTHNLQDLTKIFNITKEFLLYQTNILTFLTNILHKIIKRCEICYSCINYTYKICIIILTDMIKKEQKFHNTEP